VASPVGDLVATKASGGELLDLVRPFSAAWPVEHFGGYPLAARAARPRLCRAIRHRLQPPYLARPGPPRGSACYQVGPAASAALISVAVSPGSVN
jgi:hypothetical protein